MLQVLVFKVKREACIHAMEKSIVTLNLADDISTDMHKKKLPVQVLNTSIH